MMSNFFNQACTHVNRVARKAMGLVVGVAPPVSVGGVVRKAVTGATRLKSLKSSANTYVRSAVSILSARAELRPEAC